MRAPLGSRAFGDVAGPRRPGPVMAGRGVAALRRGPYGEAPGGRRKCVRSQLDGRVLRPDRFREGRTMPVGGR